MILRCQDKLLSKLRSNVLNDHIIYKSSFITYFKWNQHKKQVKHYSSFISPNFPPVNVACKLLEWVHSQSGLSWWATILCTTFALRTFITLPIFVMTAKNTVKCEALKSEIQSLSSNLKEEVNKAQIQFKWSKEMAYNQFRSNMRRHIKQLYIRENCHPMKSLILPWFQVPIWISKSLALRQISGYWNENGIVPHPELAQEGILWFNNLILPDPYLPFIIFILNMTIIEVFTMRLIFQLNLKMHNMKIKEKTKLMKFTTNGFRLINVIMVPIGLFLPSCLTFYWACSSSYGFAQNLFMLQPKVRKLLGIRNSYMLKK